MRVQIEVSEWEQACCGTAFQIGDEVVWTLLAADPASTPVEALPRFVEEHHGQTPDDVPHWEVTGTVRAIAGVVYPELPVTGERRSFVLDTEHPTATELSEVDGGSSGVDDEEPVGERFSEYLVELEVAPDCALPAFVLSESVREQRLSALREVDRNHERMHDPVGEELEAVADYAEATFGAVSRITRDGVRSAITVKPHCEGATAVRWARSDHDSDGIGVHTGDGSWWFPATVENAELPRVFLDAAAAGRVTEEVVDRDGAEKRLDTCVRSDDGRLWVSSTDFDPVVEDGRVVFAFGDTWDRVQRGDHAYSPWGVSS